ncbi:hypothetical protein RUM43_006710 [Polyplax serrata]|uniref:Enoyl-CoA hydratase n=1 Tax=Polyplax serrata TaxID=468196 RepID=A0AAN8PFB3_POLSC
METLPQSLNFDKNEEIITNVLDQIMLIGVNSPNKRNIITETGIIKLNEIFKIFDNSTDITVAIIHGCGGNFCTGLESNENALRKGEELLKVLYELKKPVIGSLQGYTINFGFQLAMMCDLRAMDETGLIGFGDKNERSHVPDEVYKKMVSTIGVSKALELSITNCTFSAEEAKSTGLVNQVVECGTGECV